ncbi:MAG: type II secretion system protein F [Comamonas sp. SCN 65-56]|uniref:type II secretion system F family protein n=1 Tax=Comamonas sp. SCN 65-56 TaxID=1660095 RepID=UPI00086EE1CB|nr:type II secretion system F family protein [Comamonas sp. SCN 65-56]ODS90854.1 MAG: type II secretion system protein F [Comamonas sp. SCN 65-56]
MTEFHYSGTLADGKACQGSVRAADAQAARLRLMGQGIAPVRLTRADAAAVREGGDAAQGPVVRLKRAQVLQFTREMAHLKQANMPLDRALAILRETVTDPRVDAFLAQVQAGVRGGKSLYLSLLPFERDLGRQYLVLIRAGEASGALHTILQELTTQLEADDKLRNYIAASMTYPLILMVVAVLSVIILLAFVVPQFRQIFDSMGDKLPYTTQLVLQLSDFVRGHWMALMLSLLALGLLIRRWAVSAGGRQAIDSALLGIPLMGKVLENLQFALYFRTFGTLLQRGVPMVDALRIAVDTLTNAALREEMLPLTDKVKSGQRLSEGFATPRFARTSTRQLVRVAEETGQLDATLLSLSSRCEDEGRRVMGRVLAAMEPAIIIVLGMVVAFIIVAILGGVLSINDTI